MIGILEDPHHSRAVAWVAATILIVTASISACAAPGQTEQVVIAPLGDSSQANVSGMTREELEDHVRRFADRYITRIAVATNSVRDQTEDFERKDLMLEWKTVSYAAIVDVAIGQNAVTNLLDMMTLTRLTRLVVENYWIPEVIGEGLDSQFLQTFVDLEQDIWTVADDVLTEQHQDELRFLIDEWHSENPEQIYPWYVRLSNFSGQRAASLAAVQRSGGLLKEVARAREAAEEIQAFGERVLFYLQRAPLLTTTSFETTASNVLSGPEVSRAMDDMDRFVASVERLVVVIESLPGGRLAAVDQFMDRVGDERKALLADMATADMEIGKLLAELQPALESIERTITIAKTRNPDAKPFDVNEYRGLATDSAATAIELRLLVQAAEELLGSSSNVTPLVTALVEAEKQVVDRLFLQFIALIFFFFAALLGYRFVASKLFSK